MWWTSFTKIIPIEIYAFFIKVTVVQMLWKTALLFLSLENYKPLPCVGNLPSSGSSRVGDRDFE